MGQFSEKLHLLSRCRSITVSRNVAIDSSQFRSSEGMSTPTSQSLLGMNSDKELPFDVNDPEVQRACRDVTRLLIDGRCGAGGSSALIREVFIQSTGVF